MKAKRKKLPKDTEEQFELYDILEDYTTIPSLEFGIARNIFFILKRERFVIKSDQVIIPPGVCDYDFPLHEVGYFDGSFEVFSDLNTIIFYGDF